MHHMKNLMDEIGKHAELSRNQASAPFVGGDSKPVSEWLKELDALKQDATTLPAQGTCVQPFGHNNEVLLVTEESLMSEAQRQSLLERNTRARNDIDRICQEFSLYDDQERAFRTVAEHFLRPTQQLLMYLGGMAGTGKTQVIKALTTFFAAQGAAHQLQLLAPTGAAASLIGGSTYHHFLGFRDNSNDKTDDVVASRAYKEKVRARIQDRRYLILDEVSMVALQNLHRIAAELAHLLQKLDLPFGGLHVILAGDFAQLPPVSAPALYSRSVGTTLQSGSTLSDQQKVLGKCLWYQFTTVVLLKRIMRSDNDPAFIDLLLRCRYGMCTAADYQLLQTRIHGCPTSNASMSAPGFRAVSMITALNADRDAVNANGSACLNMPEAPSTTFWSADCLVGQGNGRGRKRTRTRLRADDQKDVWALPPSNTDHLPGVLQLRIGMPVMLKKNQLTELGLTNGAECQVAGWQSTKLHGMACLTCLFVLLLNPAREIQIEGLPLNVVPIEPIKKTIECKMADDRVLTIERIQVPVLPNFAMTDFNSQGRTRVFNPIDLLHCRGHTAAYTCLSRAKTLAGVVILRPFPFKLISTRATQGLREEFQDLEILNHIHALRLRNALPAGVSGTGRADLIASWQHHFGLGFVPPGVDSYGSWELQHRKTNTLSQPVHAPTAWTIPSKKGASDSFNQNKKPKHAPSVAVPHTSHMTPQAVVLPNSSLAALPRGSVWTNNSCAYDALVSWLCWCRRVNHSLFGYIASQYPIVGHLRTSLERGTVDEARDWLKTEARAQAPLHFGHDYVSVFELAKFLVPAPGLTEEVKCLICDRSVSTPFARGFSIYSTMYSRMDPSVNTVNTCGLEELMNFQLAMQCIRDCPVCGQHRPHACSIQGPAPQVLPIQVIADDFYWDLLSWQHTATFCFPSSQTRYTLTAVVYLGGGHFTARYSNPTGAVVSYDGMVSGGLIKESPGVSLTDKTAGARKACLLIWVKQ
jgi:hypothetical protein